MMIKKEDGKKNELIGIWISGVVEKLVESADFTECFEKNKRKIVKGAFEKML